MKAKGNTSAFHLKWLLLDVNAKIHLLSKYNNLEPSPRRENTVNTLALFSPLPYENSITLKGHGHAQSTLLRHL